ncbi:hypothetical protein HDF25_003438 [Pedobacter cryoconitis]|uniref:Uncharacterized protein n=1 Tax=Pedobacter cryoconitis TaxID=188932 RepID=A0A7X0MJR2_9SPHI|nr:hypothetical protein [Pedobacter cryoconitis]
MKTRKGGRRKTGLNKQRGTVLEYSASSIFDRIISDD